jgi:hypothetical protein
LPEFTNPRLVFLEGFDSVYDLVEAHSLSSTLNQVYIRSFGYKLEPRYIFRAGRLD